MKTLIRSSALLIALVLNGCTDWFYAGYVPPEDTASNQPVDTADSGDIVDTATDSGDTAIDTADSGEPCEVFTWFQDVDGDGYGNQAVSFDDCVAPVGYVADSTDCNDAAANIHPGSGEWCNGIDDDCDASTDEETFTMWYSDADGDSFGDETTAVEVICNGSTGTLVAARDVTGEGAYDFDCNDSDDSVYPLADEYCDRVDSDCDGRLDNEPVDGIVWYSDVDGDGYGAGATIGTECDGAFTRPANSSSVDSDCNDADATVNPGASETCNEVDDDCDGMVPAREVDNDLDGLSDCNGDCDDGSIDAYPGATETCNSVDDDCDGTIDESDASDVSTFYADTDGDGYGDASASFVSCTAPVGYVVDNTDCNDSDATAYPGATEVCDSVDNDCNGTIDGSDALDATVWSKDADGDGFGSNSYADYLVECDQPVDHVADFSDCDDTDAAVNSSATEVYDDAVDNDCNGTVDDSGIYCCDDSGDGDGYGDPAVCVYEETGSCSDPSYVVGDGDCNPSNASVNPGVYDSPHDTEDADCDGKA